MNDIIILSIDCANKSSSVGLYLPDGSASENNSDLARKQAALLPGEVEQILLSRNLSLGDVDMFAVTVGPGYFTGIRIGMAYAAALAYAQNKDIVPLSSLEVLLRSVPGWQSGVKVPLIAASRERAFCAAWKDGVLILPEKERSREELESELEILHAKPEFWAVEDERLFSASSREKISFIKNSSGAAAALLAFEYRNQSIKPDELRARYLREPGLGRSL